MKLLTNCDAREKSPGSLSFALRAPHSPGGLLPLLPLPTTYPLPLRLLANKPPFSFVACRFSAMTLCNLSTHTDCKAALVSLHGLPPLIEMLEGESDLVKRYAAMTLCNLSTLAINQVCMFPYGKRHACFTTKSDQMRSIHPTCTMNQTCADAIESCDSTG